MSSVDINKFFRSVALEILGTLDIQKGLERTQHVLRRYIPFDVLTLSYYEPANKGIYRVAGLGTLVNYPNHPSLPIATADNDWIAKIMRSLKTGSRTPFIVSNRPGRDKLYDFILEYAPEYENYSSVLMDLNIEDENIGSLWLATRGDSIYTDFHLRLLKSAGELFAIALSNVRRYNRLRLEKRDVDDSNTVLKMELMNYQKSHLVGAESGLRTVMERVRQVAPAVTPVLITGETGVGKEEIARAIHELSDRRKGPFVRVNCAAITDTLVDSELFGHEEGAFTGARRKHKGYFERARGGSILLDEISELNSQIQTKLLRVIEQHEFFRVGGTQPVQPDCRIIAATNKNLEHMVRQERFRMDLFYRLNVFPIDVPPLRDRARDIPMLVSHFINVMQSEMNISELTGVDPDDMKRLVDYNWPGNVRELRNMVERALILRQNGRLNFNFKFGTAFPGSISEDTQVNNIIPYKQAEATYIQRVLELTNGRIQGPEGAAELLELHPNTLRSKMKKLGVGQIKQQTR